MFGLQVKDIDLGYDLTPVLKIKALSIIEPGVYTIVGKSGIGKTTFLETLGLMRNNVLDYNQGSMFSFESSDFQLDYLSQASSAPEVLSGYRKEHFSFIFQTTNFLDELDVLDNILISPYIQGDSIDLSVDDVKLILRDFDLEESILTKKVYELSGGQRQRISFIRGTVRNFNILFGDEPTGNLDPNNAKKLMLELRSLVSDRSAYAFIVTHDLDLAVAISDGIIPVIQHSGGAADDVYGVIDRVIAINDQNRNERQKTDLIELLKY